MCTILHFTGATLPFSPYSSAVGPQLSWGFKIRILVRINKFKVTSPDPSTALKKTVGLRPEEKLKRREELEQRLKDTSTSSKCGKRQKCELLLSVHWLYLINKLGIDNSHVVNQD